MLAPPRIHVVSALTFDNTTAFPGPWQPKNNANVGRLNYSTSSESIGRFSFKAMLRSGLVGAIIIARCLQDQITLTVRSANTAEYTNLKIPDNPVPVVVNSALKSVTLTQDWSQPLLLGPTDAITLFSDDRNTVEIQIIDVADEMAMQYLAAVLSTITPAEQVKLIHVTASTILDPFAGKLIVLAAMAAAPATVQLPLISAEAEGSEAFVVRTGGAATFSVSRDGTDLINGGATPVDFGARSGESFAVRGGQWLTSGTPRLLEFDAANAVVGGVVALPTPIGIQTARVNFTERGDLQLPDLAVVGFGCGYLLERSGDNASIPRRVRLLPVAGQAVNGVNNLVTYLGSPGSSMWVLKTHGIAGETGTWQVVADRQIVAAQTFVYSANQTLDSGWVGRKYFRLTQAGAQTLDLPPPGLTPIDCIANVVCEGAGGATINGNGANIRVNTAAPAASLAQALNGVREYKFNGTDWLAS